MMTEERLRSKRLKDLLEKVEECCEMEEDYDEDYREEEPHDRPMYRGSYRRMRYRRSM